VGFVVEAFLEALEHKVGLGVLPSEVRLVFGVVTEVTESGGLLVDGSSQVEFLDDVTGSEGEVLSNDSGEPFVALTTLDGVVGVDPDGERIRKSDGVRYLNADSVAELGVYKGLSNPSGVVGSGAVDLGGVLSGVSTSTMGAPTTVRVDDNFSSGDTSISGGTTDIELTRGVNHEDTLHEFVAGLDSSNVEKFLGAGGDDDLLNELLSDGRVVGVRVMLGRDKNVVNSCGLKILTLFGVLVLNNDLGFAVRSQPGELSVLSQASHLLIDSAGELMGEGVEGLLVVLVSSVAEHNSLISSTDILEFLSSMN